MQKNYTSGMSLRQKIVTGAVLAGIGLIGLVSGGCATQRALTPEEKIKEQQSNLYFSQVAAEREEKRKQDNLYFSNAAAEREQQRQKEQNQANQNYSVKSPEERDPVGDGIKERVGAELAIQGLLRAITDYSK